MARTRKGLPKPTIEAVDAAAAKRRQSPDALTFRDKALLRLYKAGGWLDALDLCSAGGLGYRTRVCELRDRGVGVSVRKNPDDGVGSANRHQYALAGWDT
jgi:hypothetical protein